MEIPARTQRYPVSTLTGWLAFLISVITLPVAFVAPMVTSSKFIISRHTFSLFTGLGDLWQGGEYPLFILVGLFCVVTPVVKMLVLGHYWLTGDKPVARRSLIWVGKIGKWSMIDVYLCAVLFVLLKLGFTVQITLHYGLYFFATTVITSMVSTECALRVASISGHQCSRP